MHKYCKNNCHKCWPELSYLIFYLAQSVVGITDVDSFVLQVCPGYEMSELGLDKSVGSDPANLLHWRFGVHLAEQFRCVIFLHSDGIFWADSNTWVVWNRKYIECFGSPGWDWAAALTFKFNNKP